MALAGVGQVQDEPGERLGEYDGLPAEAQAHFVVAGLDRGRVVRRLIAGGLLGVEQDEQAGDPVLGLEGAVVQQAPGLCPSALRHR